jgi:hypothetical protein
MLNKKALAASVSAGPSPFVEDVFSTWLYTGTGSSLTINNGIDLGGEGGLVWTKPRNTTGFNDHALVDSARGDFRLACNTTDSQVGIDSYNFSSTGFTLPANGRVNTNTIPYASWTFREQPKFFDVVSYTGTGSNTTILHDLGSVPGMIIVKRTDTTGDWQVYHRANTANPETDYLVLNTTAATADSDTRWNDTLPTSTVFSLGTDATVNASGGNYVAYLFAHDAGGFGEAGTDNVISCGSFTTNGSGEATVSLGYEPQFLLTKKTSGTGGWTILDSMRGFPTFQQDNNKLAPNTSAAEVGGSSFGGSPTAEGFRWFNDSASQTYIYMAIRRPMKVPTTGTSVFAPNVQTSPTYEKTFTTGFPVDLAILYDCTNAENKYWFDRLRGQSAFGLESTTTDAESSYDSCDFDLQTTWKETVGFGTTKALVHAFRRAPGFFDTVCYTGTGSATTFNHNLGAVPELMIVKRRNTSGTSWFTYSSATGNTNALLLDATDAAFGASVWNNTTPTASVFSLGTGVGVNQSASTFVAYLFATCAGVSKVGSYTGNGTTQAIACGFTGGARFVMVKATSTTGDWVVVDTARGLVSGDDPFLQLNSTAAEVTGEDILDPDSSGFVVNETTESINASGVSYIFLAIA